MHADYQEQHRMIEIDRVPKTRLRLYASLWEVPQNLAGNELGWAVEEVERMMMKKGWFPYLEPEEN